MNKTLTDLWQRSMTNNYFEGEETFQDYYNSLNFWSPKLFLKSFQTITFASKKLFPDGKNCF